MRSFVAFVLLFLGASVVRADDDPNYLYSLTFQPGMTMTRFAKQEYAESLRPTRPDGVSINWTFEQKDGAPESASHEEVEAINVAVSEALKSHGDAVLALSSIVFNHQGIWAFYTSNGAGLAAALEASLKGKTRIPIRFRVGKDPNWRAYSVFLARLRAEK